MWINKRPRLSPMVYDSLWSLVDFKVDMHKDPEQNWTKLLFIAIDDAIFTVPDSWQPEWRALDLAAHDDRRMPSSC